MRSLARENDKVVSELTRYNHENTEKEERTKELAGLISNQQKEIQNQTLTLQKLSKKSRWACCG